MSLVEDHRPPFLPATRSLPGSVGGHRHAGWQRDLSGDRAATPPTEPPQARTEPFSVAGDRLELLRGVAADAARLTALLDRIRAEAGSHLLQGPDPALVALEQAAAAACDLHTDTETALALLGAAEDDAQGARDAPRSAHDHA